MLFADADDAALFRRYFDFTLYLFSSPDTMILLIRHVTPMPFSPMLPLAVFAMLMLSLFDFHAC